MKRLGSRASSPLALSSMGPKRRHRDRTWAREPCPPRALGTAIDTAIATRQVKHLNFRRSKEPGTVAKPELGTKRLCANCGAKFYDLNKDPIVCPKCQTAMELAPVAPRARPDTPAVAPAPEEEVVAPETAEAEFVSLEEADAETQGKKEPEGEPAESTEEEVELEDESMDDASFIEEQEEGDEDVSDIVGDREDEEET